MHAVEVTDDGAVDTDLGDFALLRRVAHFIADFLQFTGVEPETAAAGALVHFDLFLRAEEMAFEFEAIATGTVAFAAEVHVKLRVALDIDQPLRGLVWFVHFLQFKGVEPYAAAAAEAEVHGEAAHGQRFERVET